MKKAGILTFHKSINYGSVLQAYALLQTIIKIGNPVEIIDYQQKNYKYLYGILRKPCSLDNIKYNLINCCFLKALLTRKKNFENFRKKYLHLSDKRYECGGNLEDIVRAYDVLICGSDQIWNPDAKDFDINFFLPFARRAEKISYAVSINGGILDTLDNKEELKDYLSTIGDSLVVVADDDIVKIHVHTNDPGLAIQKALTYGSLSRIKIDNMREEHQEKLIKDAEKLAREQEEQEKKETTAAEGNDMTFADPSDSAKEMDPNKEKEAEKEAEENQTDKKEKLACKLNS